jgi:hypothetical protein
LIQPGRSAFFTSKYRGGSMNMSVGKQVRLFLVDGTPGGLLTAEIMNWTGHVVAGTRSELGVLLRREEARRTGVYVLLGDDPESADGAVVYIGEGDDISTRLRMHAKPEDNGGKDFWNRVVVLTSKDANLTKAHARYLESRLIALAGQAKRSRIANATAPSVIQLPEADVSDMEYFISQALIVFPVLGINTFRTAPKPPAHIPAESSTDSSTSAAVQPSGLIHESPEFQLTLAKHSLKARAQEIDGEFTVLEGSHARAEWVGTDSRAGYQHLHTRYLAEGTLQPSGSGLVQFTRNVAFNSPSAAGAVVSGRACNGRTEWVSLTTGETFGAWQSRGIDNGLDDADGEAL